MMVPLSETQLIVKSVSAEISREVLEKVWTHIESLTLRTDMRF